jgi:hypothetical protein
MAKAKPYFSKAGAKARKPKLTKKGTKQAKKGGAVPFFSAAGKARAAGVGVKKYRKKGKK